MRAKQSQPSPARKALTASIIVLAIISVICAAGAIAIRAMLNSHIRHIDIAQSALHNPEKTLGGNQSERPINFLILGSDSRSSNGNPTNWEEGAQRSDVMMLVQLSSDRESLYAMSIPRDAWVNIPGHGSMKINAAFSLGGPELAISTVSQLMNVPIDHFMVVDFQGFALITDILGGVTVKTADGPQSLNGKQALAFVRERKSLPHGDFDRIRRQQAWIQSVMAAFFEKDTLSSPSALSEVVRALLAHSAVDSGISADYLVRLGFDARNIRPGKVVFFTAPHLGSATSEDGQSIVQLNETALAQLRVAWKEETLGDFVKNSDAIERLGKGVVH